MLGDPSLCSLAGAHLLVESIQSISSPQIVHPPIVRSPFVFFLFFCRCRRRYTHACICVVTNQWRRTASAHAYTRILFCMCARVSCASMPANRVRSPRALCFAAARRSFLSAQTSTFRYPVYENHGRAVGADPHTHKHTTY